MRQTGSIKLIRSLSICLLTDQDILNIINRCQSNAYLIKIHMRNMSIHYHSLLVTKNHQQQNQNQQQQIHQKTNSSNHILNATSVNVDTLQNVNYKL